MLTIGMNFARAGTMMASMETDRDDILTQVECPACGMAITAPCSQILFHRVAACACGFVIRLDDWMSSGMAAGPSGKTDPGVVGAD